MLYRISLVLVATPKRRIARKSICAFCPIMLVGWLPVTKFSHHQLLLSLLFGAKCHWDVLIFDCLLGFSRELVCRYLQRVWVECNTSFYTELITNKMYYYIIEHWKNWYKHKIMFESLFIWFFSESQVETTNASWWNP